MDDVCDASRAGVKWRGKDLVLEARARVFMDRGTVAASLSDGRQESGEVFKVVIRDGRKEKKG